MGTVNLVIRDFRSHMGGACDRDGKGFTVILMNEIDDDNKDIGQRM